MPALPRVGRKTETATSRLDRWSPPDAGASGTKLGLQASLVSSNCGGISQEMFSLSSCSLTHRHSAARIISVRRRSVAQLGRASVSKTECRGFESCRSCHYSILTTPSEFSPASDDLKQWLAAQQGKCHQEAQLTTIASVSELPGEDSNLGQRIQSPLCYHYTTGHQANRSIGSEDSTAASRGGFKGDIVTNISQSKSINQ